jgi:hypothetical protein
MDWYYKPSPLRDQIRAEVLEELSGPFGNRTHYSKSTYSAGCRGPMCRKAERDKTKERQEKVYRKSGLPYRPQRDTEENCMRDDILNQMIYVHRAERNRPIMPRRPVYPTGWFDEQVTA